MGWGWGVPLSRALGGRGWGAGVWTGHNLRAAVWRLVGKGHGTAAPTAVTKPGLDPEGGRGVGEGYISNGNCPGKSLGPAYLREV